MMIRLRTVLKRHVLVTRALPAFIPLAGMMAFFLLNRMYPFPTGSLKRPPSVLIEDRDGKVLRGFLAPDQQWRFPVKLCDLPDELIRSVIASEDRWFYWHPGVNPVSILRAAITNIKEGTIVSGASTLAMQIARLTDPKPRTYWSKCREAFRALVGSAGFFEPAFEGQVNGATSPRSPGSALKPFLFARAMDQGRILPGTYLLDIPTDFSGYIPENYDGEYRGRVTAGEALRLSLNASAVRLLAEGGVGDFLGLLRHGGLSTLHRSAEEYGLPLILGGCEVTLLELTNLYCGLARGGTWTPLRMLRDEKIQVRRRLFSREAAHLVSRILATLERPDLPRAWQLARGIPEVAWKTGTSYGHRDAWAIGFSSRYTIGVWVGNFDGSACEGISGARHATPLLFNLFRALERDGARLEEPKDLDISSIEVCSLSHQLPGPFCPDRTEITFLPGRARLKSCRMAYSGTPPLPAMSCFSSSNREDTGWSL